MVLNIILYQQIIIFVIYLVCKFLKKYEDDNNKRKSIIQNKFIFIRNLKMIIYGSFFGWLEIRFVRKKKYKLVRLNIWRKILIEIKFR